MSSCARRLAPWLGILLFGCAIEASEEDEELVAAAVSDDSVLNDESEPLPELASKRAGPLTDQPEMNADESAAVSEFARLLHGRLHAAYPLLAPDGGMPIQDEVVSEEEATIDRSLELARRLLEEGT